MKKNDLSESEAVLQAQVEEYLSIMHLKFIHIPGKLQRWIWSKSSVVPLHIKRVASIYLKGIPDLVVFDNRGNHLILELKSRTGRVTDAQSLWFDNGMQVAYNFDEARRIIDQRFGISKAVT